MKFFRLLLILLTLSSMFQSCNTLYNVQTIDIEIIEPGSLKIPASYKKLAIRYNNCNLALNPNFQEIIFLDKTILDSINSDSIASEIYFDATVGAIGEQFFFDSIVEIEAQNFNTIKLTDTITHQFPSYDSLLNHVDMHQQYKVYQFSEAIQPVKDHDKQFTEERYLHPKYGLYQAHELKEIADSTKADLLLSFDYYSALDGIFYNERNRMASEVVLVDAIWNFYDLKKLEYQYCMPKKDTVRWNEYLAYSSRIQEVLPPRNDAILNAADVAGTNFAKYLIPHWIKVNRMYYVSGHIELKKTTALVEQGKWLEAIEIWKEQANNPNKSIAAKSKFNMALACEMQGNLDAALAWVVESFHVFGQKNPEHFANCNEYISILAQRKLDARIIEDQLESEMDRNFITE